MAVATKIGTSLVWALDLAASGLPVFPCARNKRPMKDSAGFKDATTDPQRVADLFRRCPGDLIGVPTGELSGFDALDVDSAKHPEAADWLRGWGPIETRTHQTRSGGSHLLFRHEPGLKCQQSYPVPGIDLRDVIWWPAAGLEILDFPVIRWPEKLLAAIRKPEPQPTHRVPLRATSSNYAAHAIAKACRAILDAPNGLQAATLNREAFSLGTLVGAGRADEDVVRRALRETGRQMRSYDDRRPWRPDQIDNIVDAGIRAGVQRPRRGGP
jgi:hypothetical protein